MLNGVTLADPARIDVRGEVTVGRDVFIDVNVVMVGTVKFGDRVRIGPNCYLKDCEIGDDTELHPNCVIDRSIVGPRNSIGPFARLRPESVLHEDVHIGNFVEVKKSVVGAGSKANHLTYLGDATIGRKVNVGAGTVTVNYDGANKWQTQIGDNAFIGSGSMLVAPVKIGAGANTAAGSTITKDAPEGKLTIARARQTTIEGWKRPRRRDEEEIRLEARGWRLEVRALSSPLGCDRAPDLSTGPQVQSASRNCFGYHRPPALSLQP